MNTYLLLAYVFIWLCTAIVVIQKPTGIDFIASLIVAADTPVIAAGAAPIPHSTVRPW